MLLACVSHTTTVSLTECIFSSNPKEKYKEDQSMEDQSVEDQSAEDQGYKEQLDPDI